MEPAEPPRSPLSLGVMWASRVTSLALEFTLPALAGGWIGGRLGSRPVGIMLGAALGFVVGMLHLLQIARGTRGPDRPGP